MMIFCSFIFLTRARNNEIAEEKRIMYGFTFFVFFFAISRLIFFINDYNIIGSYSGHTYYGDLNNTTSISNILAILAHVIWMIGMIIFFFSFETIERSTRYVLTILGVVITIIVAFQISYRYLSIIYFMIVLITILIYLSIKSSKELKGVSAFMFTGIILIGIGSFLTTLTIRGVIYSIFPGLPPLLFLIGTLIGISPNYINQKFLTRATPIWIILIIFLVGFILFTPILVIMGDFHIYIVILILSLNIPAVIVLLYSFNRILKIFKTKKNIYESIKEDQHDKNFLKIFTKPNKISEEEISISKEKQICLVCKNEISRENYICPQCKAFYCNKCSKALTRLENACWVCYLPFDESMPSKLPDEIPINDINVDHINHKSI